MHYFLSKCTIFCCFVTQDRYVCAALDIHLCYLPLRCNAASIHRVAEKGCIHGSPYGVGRNLMR